MKAVVVHLAPAHGGDKYNVQKTGIRGIVGAEWIYIPHAGGQNNLSYLEPYWIPCALIMISL